MVNYNCFGCKKTLIQPELIPYPIPEYRINEAVLTFFHSFDNPNIDQVGQSNDRIG